MEEELRIDPVLEESDAEVRALLVELGLEEQGRYDHPLQSREQVERTTPGPRRRFTGENHVWVARTPDGPAVGLCWCVLFDPGTGLEAEIAELYVTPTWRGRGVAQRLLEPARALMTRRNVTFACVWTHPDNAAALSVYRKAGFTETEQQVLTWLPPHPAPVDAGG